MTVQTATLRDFLYGQGRREAVGEPTITPQGQVIPGGPMSPVQPDIVNVDAALRGLAAIYDSMNVQAGRVPGVQRVAGGLARAGDALRKYGKESQISEIEALSQIYDLLVPQDALGTVLAGVPPARVGKSARRFRYWHGTTPESAERIIAEGSRSGESALLGLPGTSLSRDPNVSLHRFASDDPRGLVVAEMSPRLQSSIRDMNVEDFLDTKRLISENPEIAAYNKPSSLYKELETFVRREEVSPGFNPINELKFRRPTTEEMRYAKRVHGNVAEAMQDADELKARGAYVTDSNKYDEMARRAENSFNEYSNPDIVDDKYVASKGLPTPREITLLVRKIAGSGSNTQRARALYETSSVVSYLPFAAFETAGGTKKLLWKQKFLDEVFLSKYGEPLNDLPRGFYDIGVDKNGPFVTLAEHVPPGDKSKYISQASRLQDALDVWWQKQSKSTRVAIRKWNSPRGLAILTELGQIPSHHEGKRIGEVALGLRRRALDQGTYYGNTANQEPLAYGLAPDYQTIDNSGQDVTMRVTITDPKRGTVSTDSVFINRAELEKMPGVAIEKDVAAKQTKYTVVDNEAFSAALLEMADRKVRESIRKREAMLRRLEMLGAFAGLVGTAESLRQQERE